MPRIVILACLLIVPAFAQPDAREVALGRHVMQDIERRWKPVETPEDVSAIARALANGTAIDMRVVESERPLANSLPGGIVYVSTELLHSTTPAELTAILAHQIAHNIAGHVHAFKAGELGSIPLVYMGGENGMCSRLGTPMLIPLAVQARTENSETEADSLGATYLQRAGVQSVDLTPVFARLRAVTLPLRKAPSLLR